jgi:hypothetical protein
VIETLNAGEVVEYFKSLNLQYDNEGINFFLENYINSNNEYYKEDLIEYINNGMGRG